MLYVINAISKGVVFNDVAGFVTIRKTEFFFAFYQNPFYVNVLEVFFLALVVSQRDFYKSVFVKAVLYSAYKFACFFAKVHRGMDWFGSRGNAMQSQRDWFIVFRQENFCEGTKKPRAQEARSNARNTKMLIIIHFVIF